MNQPLENLMEVIKDFDFEFKMMPLLVILIKLVDCFDIMAKI
jgi:hypothetical protein